MKTKPLTPTTIKNINSFWNWFQKNKAEIVKVLTTKIDYENTFNKLYIKFKTISTRLGFVIKASNKTEEKFTIIFTAHGKRKLFAKVNALVQQAPTILNWDIQAFIKPTEETEQFKKG